MFRRLIFAVFVFITLSGLFIPPAQAAGFYGLLRARDMSPFGFLRLDMRPAHAVSIEPGTWAVETEFNYQNSWALSPNVENYLNGLEAGGRRRLGPEDLAAIRDLPGENYLVDLEMSTLEVTAHYKFTDHVAGYVIASAVSYGGGFMDHGIEEFHDAFGFSTFGRPAVARNDVNLIYDLKSTSVAYLGHSPRDRGLLDPVVGVRYAGPRLGDRWHVVLEGAAKVAVAGRRDLLSTGRTDVGAQAALMYLGNRHAFFTDVSAVYYAGGDFPVRQRSQVVPTLLLGYEYALSANTHLNVQGYVSPSVYTHRETDLPDLLANKYQVTAGFRHRIENFLVTFGVTENLQNLNNTPDIGFQLGVAWVPKVIGR
ncbi:MAG TPA: DUF3187 family protein [Steroidobacteraceae bacterium]|nr:DUF3187 family protein [Steroidobacteraceae bacterium]